MDSRAFPRITGVNTNGNPNRLTVLMNLINDRSHINDIFVMNDVRLQADETGHISTLGHNIVINNDKDNKHDAGGCAMAIPKDCFVTEMETGHPEALLCKIQRGNRSIIVGTHYAHKGATIDETLIRNMSSTNPNCPAVLIGDFNAPLKSFGSNCNSTQGEVLRVLTESYGLNYVKNKVNTRINNIRGDDNVLDMIFTNQRASEMTKEMTVDDPVGSDHLPITIHLDIRISNTPLKISKVNDELLASVMDRKMEETPPLFDERTSIRRELVDNEIENFTKILNESRKEATHVVTVRTKNGIPLSRETSELIRERRKLIHKRARRRGPASEEEKAKCNFLDREIKKRLKADEHSFLQHKGIKITEEKDSKKRWKLMNDLMKRNSKQSSFKALNKGMERNAPTERKTRRLTPIDWKKPAASNKMPA